MEDLRAFFLIKESEQNEKSCDLDEIKELSVENLSFQYNGQLLVEKGTPISDAEELLQLLGGEPPIADS